MRNRNYVLPDEQIRVQAGNAGEMIVRFTYTEDRVEKIRTIIGRKWDPDTKCWIVPRSKESVDALLAVFEEDRVAVEPELLDSRSSSIECERISDKSSALTQMAQELRLRG